MSTDFTKSRGSIARLGLAVVLLSSIVARPPARASEAHPLLRSESGLAETIRDELAREGFENVAVRCDSQSVLIAYENRIFRDEVAALLRVLELVGEQPVAGRKVELIIEKRGLPFVRVGVPRSAFRRAASSRGSLAPLLLATEISFDVRDSWRRAAATRPANASFRKVDLVVHPELHAQFGDFADPVKLQIGLAPAVVASLWPGMRVMAQLIVPIWNELGEEGNYLRPGLIVFSQMVQLGHGVFASGTLGYFTDDRYGASLEARWYSSSGRFSAGLELGYTGYACLLGGVLYYSEPDRLTAIASAEYRFSRLDLALRAMLGRFLFGDVGLRVDFSRRFREVELGFFALKTSLGRNGGFFFSIPIFPSRYRMPGTVRLRPPRRFPWEYRYRALTSPGVRPKTGNYILDVLGWLNPHYLRNRLLFSCGGE